VPAESVFVRHRQLTGLDERIVVAKKKSPVPLLMVTG
jgi:hypothetical protein